MTPARVFVGFGFGAIQAGLFLYEAERTGTFARLVVSEVRPEIVESVRRANGEYCLNIAFETQVGSRMVRGIEMFNPSLPEDRDQLIDAIAAASEISTAVPAIEYYSTKQASDIVSVIADGLQTKLADGGPRAIIYTAENHNHAAEILSDLLDERIGTEWRSVAVCLNTVIGKMSGMILDPAQIEALHLQPLTPDLPEACLVEQFNRILIEKIPWKDFLPGITIFEQKPDLLPFEEAKLYGHNAIHSLIGFLLRLKGCSLISQAVDHPEIIDLARRAFIEESGEALIRKYAGNDPLFTPHGFAKYSDDLLKRMVNPHLADTVARITRDPRRKLDWNDRFAGTIRLALHHEIQPKKIALGMAAAIQALSVEEGVSAEACLAELWADVEDSEEKKSIRQYANEALSVLSLS